MQALNSKARFSNRRNSRQLTAGLLTALLLLLTGCGENTPTAPTGLTPTPDQAAATAPAPTTGSPAVTQPARTSPVGQGPTPTPGQTTLATAAATITRSNGEKLALTIELARTGPEQETGLMGRQSVPDETGMLFIFKQPGQVGFWMKDTPLALSIAFIDQNGKILDIQDMESFSLDVHSPGRDYLYALEVAKGYFARKGVKPGDSFTFKE